MTGPKTGESAREGFRARTLVVASLLSAGFAALAAGVDLVRGVAWGWLLVGRGTLFLTGLLSALVFTLVPPQRVRPFFIAFVPLWLLSILTTIQGSGGGDSPYLLALFAAPLIVAVLVPDDWVLALIWGLTSPIAMGAFQLSGGHPDRAAAWSGACALVSVLAMLGSFRYRKLRAQLDAHLLRESGRVAEELNADAGRLVHARTEGEILALAGESLARLGLEPRIVQGAEEPKPPEPGTVALPLLPEGQRAGTVLLKLGPSFESRRSNVELFVRHVSGALENVRHLERARAQLREVKALQQKLLDQERLAALGEAAAVMAHEVRNPLASLLNAVSLLGRELPEAQRRELLQMMHEDGQRLARLVEDLLFVARPLEPSLRDVNLYELASLAVQSVSRQGSAQRRLELEGDVEVQVQADPRHLQLAIENLVRNAEQSTQPGGRIVLHVGKVDGTARLSVEDDGPGFPPDQLHRIFEPFFSTRPAGTGLGLAIVERVVRAHGGHIRAGKAALGGARFELTLPAAA